MNTHIRVVGLLTIALCALNVQAYSYTVKNYAAGDHEVFIRFQGFFGVGEDEVSLGIAKGNGGTVSRSFGERPLQCVKVKMRIGDTKTDILEIPQDEINMLLTMKNNPYKMHQHMDWIRNKVKMNFGMYCLDRTFYIFQDLDNKFIVVTP